MINKWIIMGCLHMFTTYQLRKISQPSTVALEWKAGRNPWNTPICGKSMGFPWIFRDPLNQRVGAGGTWRHLKFEACLPTFLYRDLMIYLDFVRPFRDHCDVTFGVRRVKEMSFLHFKN